MAIQAIIMAKPMQIWSVSIAHFPGYDVKLQNGRLAGLQVQLIRVGVVEPGSTLKVYSLSRAFLKQIKGHRNISCKGSCIKMGSEGP